MAAVNNISIQLYDKIPKKNDFLKDLTKTTDQAVVDLAIKFRKVQSCFSYIRTIYILIECGRRPFFSTTVHCTRPISDWSWS